MMPNINNDAGKSAVTWAARIGVVALVSSGLWSGIARAQTFDDTLPRALPQAEPKKRLPKPQVAVQPEPKMTPVTLSESDIAAAGILTSALAECDKVAENAEPISLPGPKGEIKLDRCYRGRDHLVCSLSALLTEAKTLSKDYGKILDSNYPNVSDVRSVCGIKPESLATDLKDAGSFTARFKVLKAEYTSRASCTGRIEHSLEDVTLPDMARAPDILKSMIDSIESDMNNVSSAQQRVAELAEKIDASQRAMVTIQQIHRTMCTREAAGQRTSAAVNPARQ